MSQNRFDLVQAAKNQPKLTQEVEYKDGLFIDVAHLPRPALQKIFKDSQVMRINTTTGIREPQSDPDKFARLFCEQVISGWRGFTPRKIAKLIPIGLKDFTDEEKDTEVPFSQEQMAYLLRNAYDLDVFLQSYCQDITNFNPLQEEEAKNSESSPSGS